MKSVLCYGDSNTWGFDPVNSGARHPYEHRWTTVLQKQLGEEFLVIPEGLCSRTTVWDDPLKGDVNGKNYLIPCLESHKPVDLVILMLGTNDLKARLSLPSCDIAAGAGVLADMILKSSAGPGGKAPKVVVFIPPEVRKLTNYREVFGSRAQEISREFPEAFKKMAEEKNIPWVNTGEYVRFSDADGIHYEPDQLKILGNLAAETVKGLLKE